MSNKCWTLEYNLNAYDQFGSYTLKIFREKPDFHKLKECLQDVDIYTYLDIDAVCGMLSRGEIVHEMKGGGGSNWEIVEQEIL